MRFVLLGAASFVMLIGLLAALGDYMAAFDLELNYFHALRGLAWNVGAYTVARTLVWWAMAIDVDPEDAIDLAHQRSTPASASHAPRLPGAMPVAPNSSHVKSLTEGHPESDATMPSSNAPGSHPQT